MENFIKIIHFQLIFNKNFWKFLITFDRSRGAQLVATKIVRKWAISMVKWLPVSLNKS